MKEVADFLGIDRSTYRSYENSKRDHYPLPLLDKLAQLYALPVEDLLDDYNLFLRRQTDLLKEKRTALSLSQRQFAERLDIPPSMLKKWERGAVRISKKLWAQKIKDEYKGERYV